MKRFLAVAAAALALTAQPPWAFADSARSLVRNPYALQDTGFSLKAGLHNAGPPLGPGSSHENPYAAVQPVLERASPLLGGQPAPSIREPSAGTLAPAWLDRSPITDPKAGSVTPAGFAKYSSLSSAIRAAPAGTVPTGPLGYVLPPKPVPIPTARNSYGTPFTAYEAPTNAVSTPYAAFTDPYIVRPVPAAYGSAQIPATADMAREAAASIATGEYLPAAGAGDDLRGSHR